MFILTLWQIASFASNDTIIALFNKMDELRKKKYHIWKVVEEMSRGRKWLKQNNFLLNKMGV